MIAANWFLAEYPGLKGLAAYAASFTIGLSLGMIGAGGSILTIPIFVYILEKDPLASSVYSMFVVGISSMAGSIKSMLHKMVDFRITVLFGIPSVTGVLIARKLIFPAIPGQLFSIGPFVLSKEILFMLVLSALMFSSGVSMVKTTSNIERLAFADSQVKTVFLVLQGLLAGIITGLLGIGGGFLIVPALYFRAKLPMKMAIGTTLMIITINSLFSFLTVFTSMMIDWILLLKFSIGSILGILTGTSLSAKISGNELKKIFGWFVLFISVYIVYKEFAPCFPRV